MAMKSGRGDHDHTFPARSGIHDDALVGRPIRSHPSHMMIRHNSAERTTASTSLTRIYSVGSRSRPQNVTVILSSAFRFRMPSL
jgi:hypothetical protein